MIRTAVTLITLLFLNIVHAQAGDSALKIAHLEGDFYVYTTYTQYKGARTGANAMYLLTSAGAVLFDTPWDTTQAQPLLDSIRERHGKKVIAAFATHFHEDRTGGLAYYRKQGIATYTTKKTDSLSLKHGMNRAEYRVEKDSLFQFGQYSFHLYYPGPGHAPDNIVFWFERERVLYGGCLIKSVADKNLGNLSDADTQAYATTIGNVQRRCRNPRYVITGHNDYSSTQSLEHTLRLALQLRK